MEGVMSSVRQQDEPIQIDDLRRRKMTLEQRLEDGFVRIGEAEVQGRDVAAWEEFWLSLLGEYESVCDELEQAA
jgi:hypothetical protein